MNRLAIVPLSAVGAIFLLSWGWPSTPPKPQSPQRAGPFVSDTLELPPLTTLEAADRADRIVLAKSTRVDVREDARGSISTYTTFEGTGDDQGEPGGTRFDVTPVGRPYR